MNRSPGQISDVLFNTVSSRLLTFRPDIVAVNMGLFTVCARTLRRHHFVTFSR